MLLLLTFHKYKRFKEIGKLTPIQYALWYLDTK